MRWKRLPSVLWPRMPTCEVFRVGAPWPIARRAINALRTANARYGPALLRLLEWLALRLCGGVAFWWMRTSGRSAGARVWLARRRRSP